MRYLFILLFVAVPGLVLAKLQGKPRLDSLLRIVSAAKNDSEKIFILGHLSFDCRTIDPDMGIKYGQEALDLATDKGWKLEMAVALGHIGLNYKFKSDYATALEYTFRSLKINEEINHKKGIGSNYSNIGVIFQEQGQYTKALEFFGKSLAINEQIKDSVNMAGDLGNIGIIYNLYLADYPKALEYEFRSLRLFESLGDKDGIAHNLGNIGEVYNKLGNYTKALEFDFKALEIFEQLGDKSSIAINLGNIGETYFSIAKELQNEPDRRNVGPSQKLPLAIEYLSRAIIVSKEVGDLESIIEFSKYLSEAYSAAGDYPNALNTYKEYAALKDSVYSTDSKLKIAKLETQRAVQIKQLEVAKRHNERIFLIVVTILLLIIIGIGLRKYIVQQRYNRQLAKEKKRHLERIAEQTSVLSQIAHTQSHEVSGQVATILGLAAIFNVENPADPDNKVVIEGITEVSAKLDKIVKGMIIKENNLNKDK